ncbi:MAG TPA: trypsin-like peptidase domain-containing protein [Candidatus Dormibacteraeota bacterium]|nr:trypsin-like peptidase domain-containing protein [Candidatus Dormibacteraeota bacterium]
MGMRILMVDVSEEAASAVKQALLGQGYEIETQHGINVDQVLAFSPDVVITEAMPSDLSCCGLIAQLRTRPIAETALKIVMIVSGGALERARALDLGVDDVISFPFDPTELAARIRTQIRELQPEEELQAKLKYAEAEGNYAAAEKRRAWLVPVVLFIAAVAVIGALATLFSLRHANKETLELRAEIAELNNGIGQQGELLRRVEERRASLDDRSRAEAGARQSLESESKSIREKMSSADGTQLAALQQQLKLTEKRLTLLEDEGKFAETVVRDYGPSVCLLHVTVEFLDKVSGEPIRMILDSKGNPVVDQDRMVQLGTDGTGPPLRVDIFGTGFLATRDGVLLTNHHVAQPWWKNDDLQQLVSQGAEAYVKSYVAYFPESTKGIPAKLNQISGQADLATLRLEEPPPPNTEVLKVDSAASASVTGDPVVLMGYPTGIEGILARAGSDVANKIAAQSHDVDQIMAQLAADKLIRPTTTQGHIGDLLKNEIVYDAATTSGGSGGPLFNRDGDVIGINFAILKGFGGSNLAIPARYATTLLK